MKCPQCGGSELKAVKYKSGRNGMVCKSCGYKMVEKKEAENKSGGKVISKSKQYISPDEKDGHKKQPRIKEKISLKKLFRREKKAPKDEPPKETRVILSGIMNLCHVWLGVLIVLLVLAQLFPQISEKFAFDFSKEPNVDVVASVEYPAIGKYQYAERKDYNVNSDCFKRIYFSGSVYDSQGESITVADVDGGYWNVNVNDKRVCEALALESDITVFGFYIGYAEDSENPTVYMVSTLCDDKWYVCEDAELVISQFITNEDINENEESKYVDEGIHKVGNDISEGRYVVMPKLVYGYYEIIDNSSQNVILSDSFKGKVYIKVKDGQSVKLVSASMISTEGYKPTLQTKISDGMYLCGEEIPVGKLKLKSLDGNGRYTIYDANLMEIRSKSFNKEITVDISKGQYIKISGAESIS